MYLLESQKNKFQKNKFFIDYICDTESSSAM
jgi:hypothetical protein